MKASYVSTAAINFGLRNSTASMQRTLPDLQLETVTGRNADSGLALGSKTGELASLRHDISVIKRLTDTNDLVSVRMRTSQSSMGQLTAVGDNLIEAISLVLGNNSQKGAVAITAKSGIAEMTASLNATVGGVFVFGGENSDAVPINDYEGSPAQTAFRGQFATAFGFPIDSPLAANISKADMETFLVSAESDFLSTQWAGGMSNASSDVPDVRVSDGVTVKTSISANEESVQKLMFSTILASEMYNSQLGDSALDAVGKYVVENVTEANGGITKMRGTIGLSQERVERASAALEVKKSLLETFVIDLDGVDPYETAIQVNSLLTQIEVSYSVTARIQNLSLMQYLR